MKLTYSQICLKRSPWGPDSVTGRVRQMAVKDTFDCIDKVETANTYWHYLYNARFCFLLTKIITNLITNVLDETSVNLVLDETSVNLS
jgi:hypothetical protein